jgi:hypothetical protein
MTSFLANETQLKTSICLPQFFYLFLGLNMIVNIMCFTFIPVSFCYLVLVLQI